MSQVHATVHAEVHATVLAREILKGTRYLLAVLIADEAVRALVTEVTS